MLLLGILAVIQTVFLPGFLFVHIFSIKTSTAIQKWVYIFAFSLFTNYSLITILTLVGIYTSFVLFTLIAVEIFFIAYLIKANKLKILADDIIKIYYQKYLSYLKAASTFERVLLISISLVTLFYFSLFLSNVGTIFYFVDTVNNIHWNTWAMDFANNLLPKHSEHFPQLIPANWSISYLLIGETNVHFFPKSYMPLFFFGNLLMMLDLAFDKKNYVFLIAIIIYGIFAPIIYNLVFIADGNADLPVSFFAFLSFYAYLKTNKDNFILKEFIVVFLFASTAAGTKLAGFYIFFFISLLCLYHFIDSYKQVKTKQLFLAALGLVLIISINFFWYLLKPETMVGGLDQPEWLVEGYENILKGAIQLLYYNWGLPVLAFFILTILFSLFVKESRYITMFFVIPPIILWMFKYSSDFRNLSFVVPFISYVSAYGLIKLVEVLKKNKLNPVINISYINDVKADKKKDLSIAFFFLGGLLCFFLIKTDYFYQFLYSTYSFFSKYYFQSNRITYLIDFTFFLPVDYYQKVFATMGLLAAAASVIYLLNLKVRSIIVLLILTAFLLNFTLITKSSILNHQKEEFSKVDARNYYQTLSTILKTSKSKKTVTTNFKDICTEKIQRDFEFRFIDSKKLLDSLNRITDFQPNVILARLKDLEPNIKLSIRDKITKQKFQILFDDGDYILFNEKL